MSFAIGSIPIIPPRSTGWWHGYWPGPAWRMRRRFADSCAAPMPRPGCDDNRDGRLPVPVFMMREPLYTDGRRPPPSGPFLCGGRRRLSRPLAERRPVYFWLAGKNLPSIDNLFILTEMLQVPIDEILIAKDEYIQQRGENSHE